MENTETEQKETKPVEPQVEPQVEPKIKEKLPEKVKKERFAFIE